MNRGRLFRTLLLLAVTGAILGFAAVVGYRPELLPPAVDTQVERLTDLVDVRTAILAAGGLLAAIGLLSAWIWRTPDRTAALADVSAETPDREVDVTGEALTSEFEHKREGRYPAAKSVQEALRAALVDHYSHEFADRERAESHVDDGEWTDDRVAAATLTATGAVDFPLIHRLYAWLYPGHAYSYRIQHTLGVVEDTCAAELTRFDPPERTRGRLGRLRALFDAGGDRQ
ncbi:MAG: DUF7269 family protein [Halohasta sp.]